MSKQSFQTHLKQYPDGRLAAIDLLSAVAEIEVDTLEELQKPEFVFLEELRKLLENYQLIDSDSLSAAYASGSKQYDIFIEAIWALTCNMVG